MPAIYQGQEPQPTEEGGIKKVLPCYLPEKTEKLRSWKQLCIHHQC